MQTLNFRALCQQYGISAKTGYKWKERFLRKGLAGMAEESRRPKSHSEQLPEEEVCEIVRLKLAHVAWGPRKIREFCGGRALTTNGPMKRWGCAARGKSTSLQRENTKAHRKIWIILKMCSRRVSPKGLISLEGQPPLPQHEFRRLVCRAQAHRRGCDGSLVRSPPAGPGGFSDAKFYSGGYPPE